MLYSETLQEMKDLPKVSVVVPVYGAERYIERCVRSLMEQTYTNCEYIFVDDCTLDNSIKILKKVLENYPLRAKNVKIIKNKRNVGAPQSRKIGIENSVGDFISNVDPDDFVEQDFIESMVSVVSINVDLVWCSFYKETEDGKNTIVKNEIPLNVDKREIICKIFSWELHTASWSKLIKRDLFEKIVFPYYGYLEDMVTTLQAVIYSSKIVYCSKPTYHYVYNPSSVTNSIDSQRIKGKILGGICNLSEINQLFLFSENKYFRKQFFQILNELKCFVALDIHDKKYRDILLSVCPESVNYPSPNSRSLYYYLMKLATKYKIYFTYDLLNFAKKIKR